MGTETSSGKVTVNKKTIYIVIVLVLVIIGAFAVVFVYSNYWRKPSTPPTNDLRIIQYEREFLFKQDMGGGDYMWGWTVSIKITNVGSNNVDGVELVVELKEDHLTIDSSSESFNLQAGWETTKSVIIQAKESEWFGKNCILVATIYLGSEVLDQFTTSW